MLLADTDMFVLEFLLFKFDSVDIVSPIRFVPETRSLLFGAAQRAFESNRLVLFVFDHILRNICVSNEQVPELLVYEVEGENDLVFG